MKRICEGYYEYKGYTVMHNGGNGQWSVRSENDFFNPSWFDTKSQCKAFIDEITTNSEIDMCD